MAKTKTFTVTNTSTGQTAVIVAKTRDEVAAQTTWLGKPSELAIVRVG